MTNRPEDCRAGFCQRKLQTQAGEVELDVPKLRYARFETAIIARCQRRETLIEEVLMEMHLAGSQCVVWRISRRRCGICGVGAGTISDLNQRLYKRIDQRRNTLLAGE